MFQLTVHFKWVHTGFTACNWPAHLCIKRYCDFHTLQPFPHHKQDPITLPAFPTARFSFTNLPKPATGLIRPGLNKSVYFPDPFSNKSFKTKAATENVLEMLLKK